MIPSALCPLGHVATRLDLETAGIGRRELDALLESGDVVRARKGVYACRHLELAERIAVLVGARLDCVTVLRRHKIWVGNEKGLHLRMPHEAGGHASLRLARVVDYYASRGARILGSSEISTHWSAASRAGPGHRLDVSVMDALRQAMSCLPADDLIAALESALHLREISASELDRLMIEAPQRLEPALRQLTPGAQSGYETKARLGLQRLGHSVEIQVLVPGVGHIDMLIDGVVDLEIDGRETHEASFEEDRDRDLGTEVFGIRSLRIPAKWVDTRWDDVVAAVERMVTDARKASSPPGRRVRAEIFHDAPCQEPR